MNLKKITLPIAIKIAIPLLFFVNCNINQTEKYFWDNNQEIFSDNESAKIIYSEDLNRSSIIQATKLYLNGTKINPEFGAESNRDEKIIEIAFNKKLSPGDRLLIRIEGNIIKEPDRIIKVLEEKELYYITKNPKKLFWQVIANNSPRFSPYQEIVIELKGDKTVLQKIKENSLFLKYKITPEIAIMVKSDLKNNQITITPKDKWNSATLYKLELSQNRESELTIKPNSPYSFYPQSNTLSEIIEAKWIIENQKLKLTFLFSGEIELNSTIGNIDIDPYTPGEWQIRDKKSIELIPRHIAIKKAPIKITIRPGIPNRISGLKSTQEKIILPPFPPDIPKIESISILAPDSETQLLQSNTAEHKTVSIPIKEEEIASYNRFIKIEIEGEFNQNNSNKIVQGVILKENFPDIGPATPIRTSFFFSPDSSTLFLEYKFNEIIAEHHPHYYKLDISLPPDTYKDSITNIEIKQESISFKEQINE